MATAPIDQQDDNASSVAELPEQQDAPQLTEVEQLAAEMGWKPETEFTGPKERWKPARDFVLTEREVSRGLKQDVKRLRDTVDRIASASSKQTERALRQQADEINRKFATAVENKDPNAAAAAAKEMRELETSAQPESNDVEADFGRRNPWYGKDEDATAYAISVSQREFGKGASPEKQLEAAEEAVKKRFPELFEDGSTPKPPPGVHAPNSRSVPGKRKKTYADLPPEAKKAAEDYAQLFKQRHGVDPEKSKTSYAEDYFANIEA